MNSKELGNMFREARENKGMTVDDVYQKLKMHLRVINDIESGAFDRLAPLYMKSFIRKYAGLLELDADTILEQFESVPRKPEPKPFSLSHAEKKERPAPGNKEKARPAKKQDAKPSGAVKKGRTELKLPAITRQHIHTAAITGLSAVLVVLVFVLANMVRNWRPFGGVRPAVQQVSQEKGLSRAETDAQKAVLTEKTEDLASSPVNLTLKAKGKSWVQVKQGDKNLFASVMEKGDTHSWKADGALTVQTGKAENLEFTVNKKSLGTIAAGVVKNIKVSGEGVKIGEKLIPLR